MATCRIHACLQGWRIGFNKSAEGDWLQTSWLKTFKMNLKFTTETLATKIRLTFQGTENCRPQAERTFHWSTLDSRTSTRFD